MNVLGDAYGCGIVAHLSRLELKKLDDDAENELAKMITSVVDNEVGVVDLNAVRRSSQISQQSNSALAQTQSLRAMEALKRQSRALMFGGANKLPVSVISMPQIAITSPPESTTASSNQDTNV